MWTGKDIPADTHRVDDLRGWDLAMGLRGLLAGTWQADFDGMLELFALAPGDVSECGAFLALTGAFDAAVEAGDGTSVAAVMREVDGVMAACEGRLDESDRERLHTAAVTCFLEGVLPVRADRFAMVAPHIGTATRRWFEQWDPWRLEPGPTI